MKLQRSKTIQPNPKFERLDRADGEDNAQWLLRALASLDAGGGPDWTPILLLGGTDTLAFRLRVAQSHLRSDMLPSYWSTSALLRIDAARPARARVVQVPLLQPDDGSMATRNNGVVDRPLKTVVDPQRWPNIALIALPVPLATVLDKLDAFRASRNPIDALEHALRWLAFAWGVARSPNPLHDGIGLPSACMLETICAAAGLDLTPGLESRASCPEAIWVAARHWQDYFVAFNDRQPVGRFCVPHRYPIEEHQVGRG